MNRQHIPVFQYTSLVYTVHTYLEVYTSFQLPNIDKAILLVTLKRQTQVPQCHAVKPVQFNLQFITPAANTTDALTLPFLLQWKTGDPTWVKGTNGVTAINRLDLKWSAYPLGDACTYTMPPPLPHHLPKLSMYSFPYHSGNAYT